MANFTRKNAWNNGGTFDNPDLLWYAKGVGQLQSLSLDNPNSWWFFAAIHGEYVDPNTPWYANPPAFPDWGFIPDPPQVPTAPLPSQKLLDLYWILESVPAPELVLRALASRLSAGAGSASSGGGGEARRPRRLGIAVLELFRPSQ